MNVPRSLLLIGTLLLAAVFSSARSREPLAERLQAALDKRVQQYAVHGASAAVLFPDGTLWRGVSGTSHPGAKMSPDMAFAIGSITKNMVAALVLQLAEQGKLSLDDPIGQWLPTYPHVNPAITIRQMLNHTSGLFMFWENQALWDDLIRYRTKHFTPEEVLGYLKEPHFRPGEGYRYSNTGYLLAAMIITRATGSTLAAEMRKRFWEPLGLRSARLPPEETYPENLAHIWGDNFEKDGSYRDITFLPRVSHDSITYGSAGVFMTAEDLARWTQALFHGKVVGPDSLCQMQSFGRGAYGLGLGRFGFEVGGGFTALGHGGANIGTVAYMVYLPDYGVSIAVMVNRCFSGCDTRVARDLTRITALSLTPAAYLDLLWSPLGFLAVSWIAGGLGAAIYGVRKDKPLILVLFGGLALVAGWFSIDKWSPLDSLLFTVGGVVGVLGLALAVRRLRRNPGAKIVVVASLLLEPFGAQALIPIMPEDVKSTVRQRVDCGYRPGIVIDLSPAQQARMAHGYSGVVPIPPLEMDVLEAAGDLRSTAKDSLTFLAANRGWLVTRLQPAMIEAQRSRYPTGTPGLSVGLGWHLYTLSTGTAMTTSRSRGSRRQFVSGGVLAGTSGLLTALPLTAHAAEAYGKPCLQASVEVVRRLFSRAGLL